MLDIAQIRRSYYNPPPEDSMRVPTREELHAQYERRLYEACLAGGRDPQDAGLGEHGSLIGGLGKPLTVHSALAERAVQLAPLPLSWFCYPLARSAQPPLGGGDAAHIFLYSLSADHLAGMPERPDGEQLAQVLRSSQLSDRERSQIWHIFACIRMTDLKRLLTRAGLSLYEIARAIHLSDTRRAEVCAWINQFAVHPNEHDTLEMIE